MENVKSESSTTSSKQDILKQETTEANQLIKSEIKPEPKYFKCEICSLREQYDYFGKDPPFIKHYKLVEDAYIIEDPFVPPKLNEFIVLGSHCIKCNRSVCKDNNCTLYYEATYCIHCAKVSIDLFPKNVQEKLNKIIT